MFTTLLKSPVLDVLTAPHGVDRYVELLRPSWTIRDPRGEVVDSHRQTPGSVTLTVRPNAAFGGFRAGQFVRVGVDVDGRRQHRTYSPACAEDSELLEFTVAIHPEGLVSRRLATLAPGDVVHLDRAQGDFVLPDVLPERLVLVAGGSGITPLISKLRTLCAAGHRGEIALLAYAPTRRDALYRVELEALAARHPNVAVSHVFTRENEGERVGHFVREHLEGLVADHRGAPVAVCGPQGLIDDVTRVWTEDGHPELVRCESFAPPSLTMASGSASGTISFVGSQVSAAIGEGTLLDQAEAAGLRPEFGCRMGICHSCTTRKACGPVRNLLTGVISEAEDEDIQLCVSAPAGDVALEL